MNYTEKYHLPQWEETDRIMRTDFNDAMAGIETGIEGAKTEARQADAELTKKSRRRRRRLTPPGQRRPRNRMWWEVMWESHTGSRNSKLDSAPRL